MEQKLGMRFGLTKAGANMSATGALDEPREPASATASE
jgi:hypothetical protein